MRIRLIVVGLCVSLLAACVSADTKKLGALSVGMTKDEVIQVLGQPDDVRATQGVEYLIYEPEASIRFHRWKLRFSREESDEPARFVRIVKGRVDAYGKVGGFGSPQTLGVEIDQSINIRNE